MMFLLKISIMIVAYNAKMYICGSITSIIKIAKCGLYEGLR